MVDRGALNGFIDHIIKKVRQKCQENLEQACKNLL